MERPTTPANGSWLARRVQSFRHAFRGLGWMLATQPNARIHAVATVAAVALGGGLRISGAEWCAIVIAIGMVWSAEALNSGIEALADRVSPEQHLLIKRAKDVSAAAVLIAAGVALVIGLIVFTPGLWVIFSK